MKKFLWNIIVIIYIIMAITVTLCLLNFNDKKVTVFGNNTLILITDDSLSPDYNDGDLIIATNKDLKKTQAGDKLFFYNEKNIKLGEVKQVNEYAGASTTYVLEGNYNLIEDDAIGNENSVKVYPKIGKVLSILESKWGFLFLIIFPSVIAFLNEIVQIIAEIKEK